MGEIGTRKPDVDTKQNEQVEQPVAQSDILEIPPFKFAQFILAQRWYVFLIIVLLISIFRSGIGFYNFEVIEIAEALPKPSPTYKGLTIISPILAKLVGVHTPWAWNIMHFALLCAIFVITIWRIEQTIPDISIRKFIAVSIFGSGAAVVAFCKIGHYDIWMLTAALIIVFIDTIIGPIIAGIIFGLTNFEMGLVALAALASCAYALKRTLLRGVVLAGVAAILARGAVQLWYSYSGVEIITRASFLTDVALLHTSVAGFFNAWPVQIYSWFSATWIVILFIVFSRHGIDRLLIGGGLIALPALAAILTTDGTRVFVAASFPSLLLTVRHLSDDHLNAKYREAMSVSLLSFMMVTPGTMTWVNGIVEQPYHLFFHLFSRFFPT